MAVQSSVSIIRKGLSSTRLEDTINQTASLNECIKIDGGIKFEKLVRTHLNGVCYSLNFSHGRAAHLILYNCAGVATEETFMLKNKDVLLPAFGECRSRFYSAGRNLRS